MYATVGSATKHPYADPGTDGVQPNGQAAKVGQSQPAKAWRPLLPAAADVEPQGRPEVAVRPRT
eukprot:NODE_2795_length_873_cov_373.044010.p6 GENE.NODE_2795_length_873_cov_373.044010~~NODE_2795_length_873_cov_373.044010.p6  ORF type:complete len:64 (-),score=5.89 NODE_2795_length_873_cov_373.044010:376-567(-)